MAKRSHPTQPIGDTRSARQTSADAREWQTPRIESAVSAEQHQAEHALRLSEARFRFLARASNVLALSLELDTTLDTLARLAVASLADFCLIDLVSDDGALDRLATAHRDPALDPLTAQLRQVPDGQRRASSPITTALRDGVTMLTDVGTRADGGPEPAFSREHLSVMRRLGAHHLLMLPLLARDVPLGVITLGAAAESAFTSDDVALAEELARRAATAVHNARLFESERRIRLSAERTVERTARLLHVTGALAGVTTPQAVAEVAVRAAAEALGAPRATATVLTPDGSALELLATTGIRPLMVERFRRFPIGAPLPTACVARTGDTLIIDSAASQAEQFPALAEMPEAAPATGTLVSVPLPAGDGDVLGVLTMRFDEWRSLDDEERRFIDAVAQQCGQALERARLYRETEQASEAKSEFLAVVSHELRTPLSAIIGYQELLADGITGPVTPEQRHQLDRIHASAFHLLQLIDEILTFSRLEARREMIHADRVVVNDVLRQAVGLIEPQAAHKHLALRLEPLPEPVVLETDPGKLRQILVNLLSNAVKFTERGTVALAARSRADGIVIEVRDTGIGIPREHLNHIFDPFWQVEQKATRTVGGTGLGLSVSRTLAEMIGGSLGVESEVGQGSIFRLQLPLAALTSLSTPRPSPSPADRSTLPPPPPARSSSAR